MGIVKRPKSLIELILIEKRVNIGKLEKNGQILKQSKYFAYVPSNNCIYLKYFSRSLLTRDVLARDLSYLCKMLNIEEICVVKNEENKELLEKLIKIINDYKWSGPRLCVLRNVQKINNVENIKVILNDFHILPTSGHAGTRRMTNNIKRFYYWSSMDKDIKDFVSKCVQCQKQKHHTNTKQPMEITTTSNYAFEKIYLDVVGPLPKDDRGNVYVLTLHCELSKYIEAYPLQSKDTISVARSFVENFILRYGIPREIATDRATEFISSTMKQVCELLQIKQLTSTAYHHESIGALENSHKTMGAYLQKINQATGVVGYCTGHLRIIIQFTARPSIQRMNLYLVSLVFYLITCQITSIYCITMTVILWK